MVNKKIKKKTKWHPLSLAAGAQEEEKQVDDPKSRVVPFKMEWKINNGENNYRNNINSSNATNSATSHHNHHNNYHSSSSNRFDKRASSNKSYSKSHMNGYSSTTTQANNNTSGGNSYNKFGKQEHQKDFPKKVQFNEDEYTRITTPRQDVLFKKGYLNRPKTQPVTPTHQPYNNVPVDGFFPGYITADSPPLTINGALTPPNGADYPFIPAGHGAFMNDALNNVYGNPVIFMPYPDVFYPPSDLEMGDTYNMYNNNLYSPPLIEEHDGSVSQPVTSTTSTNCSDESESSEEVATTTTTELENPPETETTTTEPEKTNSEETLVEETLPEQQETTKAEEPEATVSPGVFENGYDSMNPYLNPYATPVYYYPMQFYPVPPVGPYSPNEFYQSPDQEVVPTANGFGFENGRHNKNLRRKKRYRKTLSSSGTSITDNSEDEATSHHGDLGFNDAKAETAPCKTPESINEIIAHQSTLNVEVPEFWPKTQPPPTNGFANNTYYNKHNNYNNKKTSHYFNNRNETRERHHDESSKQTKSTTNNIRKPLADKKLQSSSTVPVINGENGDHNVNNGSNSIKTTVNASVKKRPTNPVLEKKILIESTKNIEMQNIDLMKSKSEALLRKDGVRVETTWVVVGGKRKMIQEEVPIIGKKEAEKSHEMNGNELPATTTMVSNVAPSTNNAQTKKPSRKSKQKNKRNNNNNVSQKNTKLQGFVVEEPTFSCPSVVVVVDPKTEEESEENGLESDCEELLEAALIETIPWTDADIADVTSDEKLSDLSEASSASTSFIVNNITNNETDDHHEEEDCSEKEQEKFITDQIKAEPEQEIEAKAVNCSKNHLVEEIVKMNGHCPQPEVEEVIEEPKIIPAVHTKSFAGKNGLTNHVDAAKEETEAICEPPTTEENDAAILEISEPQKYLLTAAVCNWLHSFSHTDLQSLFTIPLTPDFVRKIKKCTEISQYFADDELQNLDKFINDHYCKYNNLSAASSLSSLLSDISDCSTTDDDDDEDDTEPTSENTQKTRKIRSTKKALKYFGCEIM